MTFSIVEDIVHWVSWLLLIALLVILIGHLARGVVYSMTGLIGWNRVWMVALLLIADPARNTMPIVRLKEITDMRRVYPAKWGAGCISSQSEMPLMVPASTVHWEPSAKDVRWEGFWVSLLFGAELAALEETALALPPNRKRSLAFVLNYENHCVLTVSIKADAGLLPFVLGSGKSDPVIHERIRGSFSDYLIFLYFLN